jgi:DNA repair protein RadC
MKVYDPTPRHQSTSTARDSEISQTPTARPRAVYVPHFRVSLVRDGSTRTESRHVHLPADGADILRACMPEDTDREVFGVLMLDVRPKVTGFHVVSVGSLTSSIIHPREVFTAAVLSKASALLLCHNHPSGDPEPSAEDIAVTRRLVSAGQLLGIEVLDHIILGDGSDRWLSLKERGLL